MQPIHEDDAVAIPGIFAVSTVDPLADRLGTLRSIVETGLSTVGLGRLLAEWTMSDLPALACAVVLRTPSGQFHRWQAVKEAGNLVVEHKSEFRPAVAGK